MIKLIIIIILKHDSRVDLRQGGSGHVLEGSTGLIGVKIKIKVVVVMVLKLNLGGQLNTRLGLQIGRVNPCQWKDKVVIIIVLKLNLGID
jgi:hypothetical protein